MSIPGSAAPFLLAQQPADGAYLIERSLRFNSSDSGYLSRTPASAGNRKTWTWAGWVKRSRVGNADLDCFFACVIAANNYVQIAFQPATDSLGLYIGNTSGIAQSFSASVYRDLSAWYHIAIAFDSTQSTASNRLKAYVNGIEIAYSTDARASITQDTDFAINSTNGHSISSINPSSATRFFSGYLADIHFIDGQALDPTSFGEFDDNGIWQPIAYTGTYGTNGFHLDFADNSSAAALGYDAAGSNDWTVNNISVGTAVRNVALSSISFATSLGAGWESTPGLNSPPNTDVTGAFGFGANYNYSDVFATAGTADASVTFSSPFASGGDTVFVFQYFGNFLTCDLELDDASVLSRDSITANNDNTSHYSTFTIPAGRTCSKILIDTAAATRRANFFGLMINGVSVVTTDVNTGNDSLVDVPTNGTETDTGVGGEVRGNYCTWNPLDTHSDGSGVYTLTNGNLEVVNNINAYGTVPGTIFVDSGKWYWEISFNGTPNVYDYIGIQADNATSRSFPGNFVGGYWYRQTGDKTSNADGFGGVPYATSWSTAGTDIIGVALDADNKTLAFYKNGVSLGVAFTGISSTSKWAPAVGDYENVVSTNFILNAGQRPFAYTAPSGFKALNTANLPAPVVTKPSEYMDVALYTGNGSTQTISGFNFSPDLVWSKSRNRAYPHGLHDSVRGAYKYLRSNGTNAETDTSGDSATYTLTSFNSDGFSVGADGGAGVINNNAAGATTYVAWAWDAGSSTVTNTDGSITSSVRANASAGFSIVSYTGNGTLGATVGHGLGVKPSMVIIKSRSIADDWLVAHDGAGVTGDTISGFPESFTLYLQSTAAKANFTNAAAALGSSSVFAIADGSEVNQSSATYVAYCFAPVAGYSSMGSYTGNGSADGPFVYTGFRPRYMLIKRTDAVEDWAIRDTARSPYNASITDMAANQTYSDFTNTGNSLDILSNGFKPRNTRAMYNASGGTYIYAAFSEVAFNFARAR
jgi:hypothetical protein